MDFTLIRRFFMYLADFWAKFCNFLTIILFLLPQMGIEKTPIT